MIHRNKFKYILGVFLTCIFYTSLSYATVTIEFAKPKHAANYKSIIHKQIVRKHQIGKKNTRKKLVNNKVMLKHNQHHKLRANKPPAKHNKNPSLYNQQLAMESTQLTSYDNYSSEASEKLLRRLSQLLDSLRYTQYQLGGNYFDTRRGIYNVDCSRYVDRLLADSTPAAFESVKRWSGNSLPQAKDYYMFFDALPYGESRHHWYHIKNTGHLRPGDLIAYRKQQRNASGHVMVVTGMPERDYHYDNVYRIRVSDSANSGHSNDTRGRHGSGVGVGTLLLRVDPDTGIPYQVAWREGSRWEYNDHIAMGRPMD